MNTAALISTNPASIIGLAIGALLLVLLLGVVGVFVVIVVANRADPDPTGRRPFVVYLFGVSFIALWTSLIGSAAVVSSLVQLIGRTTSLSFGAIHPVGDAVARGVVLGGLIFLASLVAIVLHLPRGRAIVAEEDSLVAPSLRTARSYGSAACFLAVLVMIIALVAGIYAVFQLVAPGVFQGRGRIPALRSIIEAGWVVLASGAILAAHLKMAGPGFGIGGGSTVIVEPVVSTVIVEEPPSGAPL